MDAEALAQSLDEAKKAVELMSGIKADFAAAGWSETMAERMTLEMLRRSTP